MSALREAMIAAVVSLDWAQVEREYWTNEYLAVVLLDRLVAEGALRVEWGVEYDGQSRDGTPCRYTTIQDSEG